MSRNFRIIEAAFHARGVSVEYIKFNRCFSRNDSAGGWEAKAKEWPLEFKGNVEWVVAKIKYYKL